MKKVVTLYILILFMNPLFSQVISKREFAKELEDADIIYNYGEDYEKAANIYTKLLKSNPDNSNLTAKLGMCYLYMDGKKPESLKLLKKAFQNAASTDAEYTPTGIKAPVNTWMYLAQAYSQNDSINKALEIYNGAKRAYGGTDPKVAEFIENRINDCKLMLQQKKAPLVAIPTLFTPWLRDYPGACSPVISKNDSVFVFTQKQGVKTRVFCSYNNGTWQPPINITDMLGGYDRFYTNSITGDGKFLVLFMDDGEDGNLYYSERRGSTWSKIKSMGSPINTIYWESHGFITPDGKHIYIASNRPGSKGRSDIWLSDKNPDGSWTRPENLGDAINTPSDETTPFYDPDTKTLLFSSTGHISVGNAYVFRSVFNNGLWTTPVGIPYVFSGTADNQFFILNNDAPGFITSIFVEKMRMRNIFAVVAEDPAEKITPVKGTIKLSDGKVVDPKKVQLQLSDFERGSKKNVSLFDSTSFKFDVKPGDYMLVVSHAGYQADTINFNLPLGFKENFMALSSTMSLVSTSSASDFLSVKNILFDYNSSTLDDQAKESLEAIRILMVQHPNATLEIAGYTDSKGSTAYNMNLADKRAQVAIEYLTKSGIPPQRLIKKAYGATDFVIDNTNSDGSDNPEGRKYNRRVMFGVRDPKTGVTITQEAFAPQHLRHASSVKYSVVLISSHQKLADNYFANLKISDMISIKTEQADTTSLYILGYFKTLSDANKYRDYAKENGFTTAYVINEYEIKRISQ